MIYFDNAATCGTKPKEVTDVIKKTATSLGVNVGRGNYKSALKCEKIVYECRKFLSETFNNGRIDRLIFTSNCTHALNQMIFGCKITGTEIVTSVTEHNSVLRPLYRISDVYGMNLRFVTPDENGVITAKKLLNFVNEKTAFVVLNAVSNVTGGENEFEEIGKSLNGYRPFFVDGAQFGGHEKTDMRKCNISAMAFAGHKGFFALQGVGALALNENFDLFPVLFGGSGTETFAKVPSCYPEKLEAGTINFPAIESLLYGAKFAYDNLSEHTLTLKSLSKRLIDGLLTFKNVKIYSDVNKYGIVSFEVKGVSSQALGNVLGNKFDIAVRGGYHCAPLIHSYFNTEENGLVRVSFSPFNTVSEVDEFLNVLPYAVSLCF